MAKDSFYVFNSMHRDEAEKHVKDGDVVVYNMGLAFREVDEEGHRVPIGHYGVLPESNSILEGLIEAGLLNLIGGDAAPKKKATPKKAKAKKYDKVNKNNLNLNTIWTLA